jgi:hypothetical protein
MENHEIVLLTDTYKLAEITLPENREKLVGSLGRLDGDRLTDLEVRQYFNTLKLAMGVFIQKISNLESSIIDLKRDQVAAEARMESMYLKARLEIQALKQEITEAKLSRKRIGQIVKVAEALKGNAYAPYAIKSLVDGVVNSSSSPSSSDKLPGDYEPRLTFAQMNGFKWNQNNREPAKPAKRIQLLEQWEDEFCKIENLSIEFVVDKKYVASLGQGAIAGALMFLERELGYTLEEERKTLSVFNCYQKAIKLYQQLKTPTSPPPAEFSIDLTSTLTALFPTNYPAILPSLEKKSFSSETQFVSVVKKLVSKKLLPAGVTYDKEHRSDVSKLYAIQGGHYDLQIASMVVKTQ